MTKGIDIADYLKFMMEGSNTTSINTLTTTTTTTTINSNTYNSLFPWISFHLILSTEHRSAL
jgi:hypothetical protein